jgi:hypothetical protein
MGRLYTNAKPTLQESPYFQVLALGYKELSFNKS